MYLLANKRDDRTLSWRLVAQIYVSSKTKGEMIFPFHACSAIADIGDHRRRVTFGGIFMKPYPDFPHGGLGSLTLQRSSTDIIISSAGMATFNADTETSLAELGDNIGDPAHIRIELVQVHDSRPITLSKIIQRNPTPQAGGNWGAWGTQFI